MRLLRAELARLFGRRFTKVMTLALATTLGVIAAVLLAQTHQPTPDEMQRAQAQADAAQAQCEQQRQGHPEAPDRLGLRCEEITTDQFLGSYALNFRSEMPGLLLLFAGLLALFGYLVGASFLGAEWSSGGMANLLLWRSQRVRVLLGKLTALLLGILLLGLLFGAVWVAVVWLTSQFVGRPTPLSTGFWISLGLDGARGMALAMLLATAGAAIASLGRRTAAALGLLIGYLVVWELGALLVMQMLEVITPERFMLSSYVYGLISKEHVIHDASRCWTSMDGCVTYEFTITWPWALALLLGLSALSVLSAAVSFRRRDIV